MIMKDNVQNNATGGAVYGLGFIGAAIYFISHATGFLFPMPQVSGWVYSGS